MPLGSDPSNTDKLAQRNLAFVNVPNPGAGPSRRAPQTFEIRPSPAKLLSDRRPDELQLDFSELPLGTRASIYLPAVSSATILALATRLYTTHRLTAVGAHTIEMPASGTGFVPIPQGDAINFTGLLTVDLPGGIKKGQTFKVPISQITSVEADSLNIQSSGTAQSAKGRSRRAASKLTARPASTIQAVAERLPWRRVLGQFRLTLPILTKEEILPDAERLLSISLWTYGTIPPSSRWYRVYGRYLDQLKERVTFLGGNPAKVHPSPTGVWQGPGPSHDCHEHREHVPGKIEALSYDHFGDFEGFVLESTHGHRRFFASRERRIEDLARRACAERLTVVVFPLNHGDEVASLLVHEA